MSAFSKSVFFDLAGAEGLEPPTIGFGDRCSTNWNYAPASKSGNYTQPTVKVKPQKQLFSLFWPVRCFIRQL